MEKRDIHRATRVFRNRIQDNRGTSALDVQKLDKKLNHYLFVYGTLKYGFNRHLLINTLIKQGEANFMGLSITQDSDYSMYIYPEKGGGYPIVFQGTSEKNYNGRILGEMYSVPSKLIYQLDYIESNGELYDRKQKRFLVGDGEKEKEISGWIYLARKDVYGTGKESGQYKKQQRFTSKSRKFVFFDYQYPDFQSRMG